MSEEEAKRKVAAILSADAKDYSRLVEDDGEATVRTIKAYRELMVGQIQNQNCRVWTPRRTISWLSSQLSWTPYVVLWRSKGKSEDDIRKYCKILRLTVGR
jgi:hypothetical protein